MSSTAVRDNAAAAQSSRSRYTSPAFWEGFWRTSGLQFVGLFIVAYFIYGTQPPAGASADALTAFFNGERTRILIAVFCHGLNLLNLLWFTMAVRTILADAGEDGWGSAAIAASAAFGSLFLLGLTVAAALAYSIAGAGNGPLTSGLNDLMWALLVLSSFPRAMLIMASTFGLWRAGQISNALFTRGGFWAPAGAYSRLISPLIGLAWAVVVSRVVLTRSPATRTGW
jgi:hypothetical protein